MKISEVERLLSVFQDLEELIVESLILNGSLDLATALNSPNKSIREYAQRIHTKMTPEL